MTFNFIGVLSHIIVGFILFALVIITLIFTFISKPAFRPIQRMTIVLFALVVIQILLGFYTLDSGSQAVAWVHFVNALAIYGLVISGTFMTRMMGKMKGPHQEAT